VQVNGIIQAVMEMPITGYEDRWDNLINNPELLKRTLVKPNVNRDIIMQIYPIT
jgi:hypothetical protein